MLTTQIVSYRVITLALEKDRPETELNKLQTWINANNLNYDSKKSSYGIFKPRNKSFPRNCNRGLKIGINTLKFKETTKYLGLLLDSKLILENHIQDLNKKLVKYTGIFSKVRHYLPITCRKTVYNAFIFSRLNYGSEIYLNTTKKYINPLLATHKNALEFNTLKLKDLHYCNICCIVHKFIHTPTYSLFKVQLHGTIYLIT